MLRNEGCLLEIFMRLFNGTLSILEPNATPWRQEFLDFFRALLQGNLIQGEGSDSLKTTLETKGKTA